MKGVVLAAGDGGRLHPLTLECPKVLLPMRGRPLISYPIEAMVEAGITDITVVIGYWADLVAEKVAELAPAGVRLSFVHNSEHEGGNAISVRAAKAFVGDDSFVLCMGDHVIERTVIARLLEGAPMAPMLAVDSAPSMESQVNDATRVAIDHLGHIQRIGKEITEWNAVDTGVFLLSSKLFEVVDQLRKVHGSQVEMNQVVQYLADHNPPFATKDINGLFWTDVDTLEDYASTEKILEQLHGLGV
jgi:choline kinase